MRKKYILWSLLALLMIGALYLHDTMRRTFSVNNLIERYLLISVNTNIYYADKESDKIEVEKKTIDCTENDLLAAWRLLNNLGEDDITNFKTVEFVHRRGLFHFAKKPDYDGRTFIVTIYAANAIQELASYDNIILSLKKTITEYLCQVQQTKERQILYIVELT